MKVYKLTKKQKDLLVGIKTSDGNFYHPVKDGNNNWIISKEEVYHTNAEELSWVHELKSINYKPAVVQLIVNENK